MPAGNPAGYVTDDPIVQQLINRGLLATGGNIRSVPFGNSSGSNSLSTAASASGATSQPSKENGVTRNADGTYNVQDEAGNIQTVDVRDAAEKLGEDPNSDLSWLAATIAGASGALIGNTLARRRGATPVDPLSPLPEDSPRLPGTVGVEADPTGGGSRSIVPQEIIDGEFTVVEPERINVDARKALPAPQPKVGGATAKQIASRKAQSRSQAPTEQSRIIAPDEFADLSPEEMARARMLAEQLVMQRQRGNVRAYKPGVKGVGPQHLPTSRGRATDKVDDMLGNVVRMIREGKIKPSQLRTAIP